MSYTNTFILVADDCPAQGGVAPPAADEKPTVAALEYELLTKSPYRHTRDELLFIVHVTRLGLTPADLKARGKKIHAELFAKSHPCMRASPLPKRYGWGVHHNAQGRIALVARGSQQYDALSQGPLACPVILKAMRNAGIK
jgi:hypothetical protein